MRDRIAADPGIVDPEPDPLAPARGILRGCALGCLAWIGLALIVGRCVR